MVKVIIFLAVAAITVGAIWMNRQMRMWSLGDQIGFLKVGIPAAVVLCLLSWGFVKALERRAQTATAMAQEADAVPETLVLPEDADDRIGFALQHRLFYRMQPVADWATIQPFLDENRAPEIWIAARGMMHWDLPQAYGLARFMVEHPACPDVVALDVLRILAPGVAQGIADDPSRDVVAAIIDRDRAQGFVPTSFATDDAVDAEAIRAGIRALWGADAPLPDGLLARPAGGSRPVRPYVADETGLYRVEVEA
ncbi:hypothetical protein [Sagittula sp. S175]|uniref:hypothetical protein n=1 Tax=Sagittula sp. S175 TaxID=3415129 RepID=UPI003C7CD8DD